MDAAAQLVEKQISKQMARVPVPYADFERVGSSVRNGRPETLDFPLRESCYSFHLRIHHLGFRAFDFCKVEIVFFAQFL